MMAPIPTRRRTSLLFAAKLAISSVLLFLLFRQLGSDALLEVIGRAKQGVLLLAAVVLVGQTALSALKWQILLRRQGVESLGYLQLLKIYLIGNFINLFMPSMLVGDAYRAARVRTQAQGWQGALPSILVDRGTGLAVLLFLGMLGLLAMYMPRYLLPGAVALVICAALVYAALIGPAAKWAGTGDGQAKLRNLSARVIDAIRPSRLLAWIMLISCTFHFNTIAINWLYCQALDIPASFPELLAVVPAVYLLEMVPLSINGLGVREGAFAVLFGQIGQEPLLGLALGLTVSVMRYVAGLVGGVLLAVDTLRTRHA